MIKTRFFLAIIVASIFFSACELEEQQIPTKTRMEGVWQISAAYNDQDSNILNKICFPIAAFHLSSDNTIISTGGPMTMYMVYGGNKYTEIASKIDQVFNYTTLDFNGGEFFIADGVQDRFTLEMKLEGLPGQKALTSLLEVMGIHADYLNQIVYHKFVDVAISFEDEGNTMIWQLDNQTTARYNIKNSQGDYVLWQGWPVTAFSKSRFVFTKKSQDLKTLVSNSK